MPAASRNRDTSTCHSAAPAARHTSSSERRRNSTGGRPHLKRTEARFYAPFSAHGVPRPFRRQAQQIWISVGRNRLFQPSRLPLPTIASGHSSAALARARRASWRRRDVPIPCSLRVPLACPPNNPLAVTARRVTDGLPDQRRQRRVEPPIAICHQPGESRPASGVTGTECAAIDDIGPHRANSSR